MSIPTDHAVHEVHAVHAETRHRPLKVWIPPLAGVAAAIAGLLPWFVTGMRLPLQNLWATETLPDAMPIVLLPFSQYTLTIIVALLVTGAAFAALVARATRQRQPRGGVVAMFIGLLATQVIAAAQTATVVRGGLDDRAASDLYFVAVLAVVALSILVGTLVFWLIATAPRAGALIGLSIGAIACGIWFSRLLVPLGAIPPDWLADVAGFGRWIPPILIGIAIAWCGVGTAGRVVAAASGLLLLWIAPALITGVANAAGSRVLAEYPAEMLDYAVRVTRLALFSPELALPPIIVAASVATAGLIARAVIRRRGGKADQGPASQIEAA